MNKEYVMEDIFHKVELKRIKKTFDKAKDISKEQTSEFNLPLINAKNGDNGIMYYGRMSDWESDVFCIDIINDGAISTGNVYAQPQRTGVLYNAYMIKPNKTIESEEILLFLAKTIEKAIKHRFGYDNKATWEKVKIMPISLPVIENPNPDHKYTIDDIDWQYMRDRITELERDSITELDAYLQATGLNDYELTEDDKKILSLSAKRASDENGTLEDNSEDEVRFGEFDISDIYEVQKVQHKLDKSQIKSEGDYPCFSSDTTNNGILGYTDNPEFHISDETKVYIIFGDHTRTFDIATTDFSVLDNVKVLKPVTNNIKALQYINSVWGKSIPNLGYARHWSVAKDRKLSLPIKSDGTPDFDYMEKYIRAIEKVVIADVVKYKDKVIETTKKVIGV